LIRFQALYPDITVERHEMNTAQQIAALKRNNIDLGFALPAGSLLSDAEILTDPIKYRFINDMEPMAVQNVLALERARFADFRFRCMVTEEACRWRALNLQPGASRDKYALRFTCRID
jgi:DNA-binding transcriptional LysR family regulator